LAMVDASIGGKNGIDVEVYKNMVGTIRQPAFILYDSSFLDSLPGNEWINGFAEIIKHACIKDRAMFLQLEKNTIEKWRKNKRDRSELIRRNVLLKTGIVRRDVTEKGERRLLNFGHTLGHALENQYELSHGQAISIGMAKACRISESITGFPDAKRVTGLLNRYGLPTDAVYNKKKVFEVLKMDKKREKKEMNYVLLERIGKGLIKSIPLKQLGKFV
ncbi:MAG TPA: 3-dehydroquinate synthase family protein, partial [Chitinophagaceae bacterium]|nr:3-dehydroquinate synthase family protein [Chitinophagaceae bacterium]